jgi:hypothetical protein
MIDAKVNFEAVAFQLNYGIQVAGSIGVLSQPQLIVDTTTEFLK